MYICKNTSVFVPLRIIISVYNYTLKRSKYTGDKKVLLRERKRHTTRRVVSTPSVVLTGYPPSDLAGGYPQQGTPPAGYPPPAGPGRVPPPPPPTGPGMVPPPPQVCALWHSRKCCKALWDMGPPPGVCPMAFWVMLQSIMGYGYPPPGVDRLKTLPSPSFGCGR